MAWKKFAPSSALPTDWLSPFPEHQRNLTIPTPAMASDLVLNLDDSNFDAEIAAATVPVVVDFWAEWCGPCRMLGPVLDQLATEKAGSLKVVKVNVDNSPNLAAKFNVRSIPMLLYIKDGAVKDTSVGVLSKDAIANKVAAIA